MGTSDLGLSIRYGRMCDPPFDGCTAMNIKAISYGIAGLFGLYLLFGWWSYTDRHYWYNEFYWIPPDRGFLPRWILEPGPDDDLRGDFMNYDFPTNMMVLVTGREQDSAFIPIEIDGSLAIDGKNGQITFRPIPNRLFVVNLLNGVVENYAIKPRQSEETWNATPKSEKPGDYFELLRHLSILPAPQP